MDSNGDVSILSEVRIQALQGVDLKFPPQEFVVLLGASGSGKSTLLNILGGLDSATSGELFKHNDQWALYLIENNKARLKIVNISKRNESEAVITDGVKEGDEIILFPGDRISDQTRVRAR